MICTHPAEVVLCGPLHVGGESSLLPITDEPQNIREQREQRSQWCSRCGAFRDYPHQEWALPEAKGDAAPGFEVELVELDAGVDEETGQQRFPGKALVHFALSLEDARRMSPFMFTKCAMTLVAQSTEPEVR